MLEGKYKGKLNPRYEEPQHSVVAQVFRGLAGKKVVTPSKDFSSHHQQSGVKCSIKANEGHLFCLDKSFMFVPKPATYISFDTISVIVMSRVGGAVSASRTFDITVMTKNGGTEHQFSNINRYVLYASRLTQLMYPPREEQKPLEDFFQAKNLKVRNEMLEDVSQPHEPPPPFPLLPLLPYIIQTGAAIPTHSPTNITTSPPPSSKPPSTTPTSPPQTKKSSPPAPTAAPQTKTPKAQTRTSNPIPSPTSRRNTTRRTRAAAAGVMRRWRMVMVVVMVVAAGVGVVKRVWSLRRRKRRRVCNLLSSVQEDELVSCMATGVWVD